MINNMSLKSFDNTVKSIISMTVLSGVDVNLPGNPLKPFDNVMKSRCGAGT